VKWGKTSFVWDTVDPSSGPREDYAPGARRAIAMITVLDGSPAGRAQAATDLIGYASPPAGDKIGTNLVTYFKRTSPLPYPGAENLYLQALTNGQGLGVASHGPDGVSFAGGYQFQATFTSRPYLIKEDRQVKAQATAGLVQSPLYDPAGVKTFPDEGDALKRGWQSSRYVSRRFLPASRFITTRAGFLAYVSDNVDVPETFPFNEGLAQVRYVWHAVPVACIPFNAIQRCMGGVNTDGFDFAPPHTLLLTSMEYDAQPGPLGPLLADVAYGMLYLPRFTAAGVALGHAAMLRVFTAGPNAPYIDYDKVGVKNNAGRSPFRGGDDNPALPGTVKLDFADLFRPDQPAG
jgi:hypothetical protein